MNKNGHPIEIEGTSLMDICKHLNKKINTSPANTIHSLLLNDNNGEKIKFNFGITNIFVCSHDRKIVYCLNPITDDFCILFPDDDNNLILANDPVIRSSLARKHTLTDAEIRRAKQLNLANRIRTSIMNKNTKKNVIPNILKEKNAKTIINNSKAKKMVNKNNTAKKNNKTPQIIQKNIHTNIVNKKYTEKKKFPALETTYKNIYLKQLEQKKKKTIAGKERRDLIKNENQIMKKTYAGIYKKPLKKNNNSRMISEPSDENKTAKFHYCNHCYTCKATKKLNAKKNNSKQMMINKDKTLTLEQQKKPNDKQTTKKTYADIYKEQLEEKNKNCNKQIINQKTVKPYDNTQLVRK